MKGSEEKHQIKIKYDRAVGSFHKTIFCWPADASISEKGNHTEFSATVLRVYSNSSHAPSQLTT
jgi:hypothetical protein